MRTYGHTLEGSTNAPAGTRTNLLAEAIARFDQVVRLQPPSPLAGRAHLNRGWALWAQDRLPESQDAFKTAVQTLPFSEDQAVAQYKLGETQARLHDVTNAIATLREFTNRFASLPRVQNTLMDQGLLHLVRLYFETRNPDAAQVTLDRLLTWKPDSSLVDSSLLFMGNRLTLLDEPEQARRWLSKVADNSPAKPIAELAIARTFSQQGLWTNSLLQYSNWLARFTNQLDLRPRAEFNLSWTTFQCGSETNAYQLFTNFVASHPMDALAPMAEFWIGDHYYRQQDYTNAEIQFRRIYQNTNWPLSELTYEAKMQEGRAAFARKGFNNAQELFTQILNEKPAYPDLVARAFLAYGDCLMIQAAISTNAFARYEEASKAFRNLTILYATNSVAPKAWGNLGNCYLQLAQQDPAYYYSEATNSYQQVINHPLASIVDRSQAEIGIGIALKKRADTFTTALEREPLLERAQFHWHRVLYEKNLLKGESPDPFWQKKAGLESAQLAEAMQDWKAAAGIYERLRDLLPQLGPYLDRQIARVKASQPTLTP